jgi:high-affinity K+ transport system ATPase subunit B
MLEEKMPGSLRYRVIGELTSNPAFIATELKAIVIAVVFFMPGMRPAFADEREAFFIVSLRLWCAVLFAAGTALAVR